MFYTAANDCEWETGGEAIRQIRGSLEAMPSETHTLRDRQDTRGGEDDRKNTGRRGCKQPPHDLDSSGGQMHNVQMNDRTG